MCTKFKNLHMFCKKEKPILSYIDIPQNENIIANCPSFKEFKPMPLCHNGIVQTMLQDKLPVPFKGLYAYLPEIVSFPDRVCTTLDWKEGNFMHEKTPIIVCLHGLGGDSSSRYLEIFTNYCCQLGYRPVVYNRRGHGKGSLFPPSGSFQPGASGGKIFPRHVNMDDMDHIVKHIHKKYPNAPKYLVGFSCGGNLAINYIAKEGIFQATVCICNGFD